ncbi:transcription initiation factor tfiid subunit [Anaeramoeba flamelloides]|uniref:Transcription initiation factor tfiid subunit n=1 Tax=Anaeramoeba flamelloides TaxID=1746091 RepID=A0AAV7Z9L8_9EUKA|nr:transcription initiation factor tfiid subunit [Anaeramoeba flamelloides]
MTFESNHFLFLLKETISTPNQENENEKNSYLFSRLIKYVQYPKLELSSKYETKKNQIPCQFVLGHDAFGFVASTNRKFWPISLSTMSTFYPKEEKSICIIKKKTLHRFIFQSQFLRDAVMVLMFVFAMSHETEKISKYLSLPNADLLTLTHENIIGLLSVRLWSSNEINFKIKLDEKEQTNMKINYCGIYFEKNNQIKFISHLNNKIDKIEENIVRIASQMNNFQNQDTALIETNTPDLILKTLNIFSILPCSIYLSRLMLDNEEKSFQDITNFNNANRFEKLKVLELIDSLNVEVSQNFNLYSRKNVEDLVRVCSLSRVVNFSAKIHLSKKPGVISIINTTFQILVEEKLLLEAQLDNVILLVNTQDMVSLFVQTKSNELVMSVLVEMESSFDRDIFANTFWVLKKSIWTKKKKKEKEKDRKEKKNKERRKIFQKKEKEKRKTKDKQKFEKQKKTKTKFN